MIHTVTVPNALLLESLCVNKPSWWSSINGQDRHVVLHMWHLCYLFIAERGVCVWTGNSRQASWEGKPGVDDGEVREQDHRHARHVRGTKGGRRPATGTWQWRFRHGLCPLLCMKYLSCWFSWFNSVIFFYKCYFKNVICESDIVKGGYIEFTMAVSPSIRLSVCLYACLPVCP